jgi:hypothetical protein
MEQDHGKPSLLVELSQVAINSLSDVIATPASDYLGATVVGLGDGLDSRSTYSL